MKTVKPLLCTIGLILTITLALPALAAEGDSLWSRTYGGIDTDGASSVIETSDGGFLLAGSTASVGGGAVSCLLMMKTDEQGNQLWLRTLGGPGNDMAYSVIETSDGGFLMAGRTSSFGSGQYDMWLVKTDYRGDSLWSRTFGGNLNDEAQSVVETFDGSFLLAGYTRSFGSGSADMWLLKTNDQGDSLWSHTYGGAYFDWVNSLVETSDGNIMLAGGTKSFSTGGSSDADMWLVKVDNQGDSLWSRTYGGFQYERVNTLIETGNGDFLLAGYTYSFGSGGADMWLVRTDNQGDSIWSHTYGGSSGDYAYSIIETSDGGYLMAGKTISFGSGYYDMLLVKTDVQGYSLWASTYGGIGGESAESISETRDHKYILAGYTSSFGAGENDMWLVCVEGASAQTVIPGGYVSGTWEASGSPYLIMGEITIHSDSTLNIERGVEVNFQGHYKLIVNGFIEAMGAEGDSILFTAADTSEGWHGIRFMNAPDSSHLSYCIIEYGRAFGDSLDHHGGGIMCESSNPVINRCTISRNSSDRNGGGIYCTANESSSSPTIHHSSITGNWAAGFGGGFCSEGDMYPTEPNISQCDISENSASTGGGISLFFFWPTISFCTINNNVAFAGYGGGIYSLSAVPLLDHCTFNGNSSTECGGAIASYWCGDFTADHCVFSENTSGSDGGAIWVDYNTWPSFINCTISNNSSGQNGGGIYVGPMCCLYVMRNTIVEGNHGNGGVYFRNVVVCTITYSDFSVNEFGNFLGNSIPEGLGELVTVNANGDSCDVFSNIFLNPEFVYPNQNNLRLQWDSPCIDAGDPDPSYNDPDGTVADMGAFYYDQSIAQRILLTPYNMPIVIPPGGSTFEYAIRATWIGPVSQTVTAWCDVTLPNGSIYGPTLGPVSVLMDSGMTIDRVRTQMVPPAAPVGSYSYNAYATADSDTSMDSFTFVKLGSDGLDWLSGWFNTGESFTELTAALNDEGVPRIYSLDQNYPNPFNPVTTISFGLPDASRVTLAVYDVTGRLVAMLVNGWREAGMHEVTFDGSGLASGIYIYCLQAGDFTASGKMVLMK